MAPKPKRNSLLEGLRDHIVRAKKVWYSMCLVSGSEKKTKSRRTWRKQRCDVLFENEKELELMLFLRGDQSRRIRRFRIKVIEED